MKRPRHAKFTPAAEIVFNLVYDQSINRQIFIKHPQQPALDQKHWQTLCFNFAYLAASAYEGKDLNIEGTPLLKK